MSKQRSIPDKMYFRIGEAAEILEVKPYVLRYWETEFPDIKPVKSQSKQRLYKRRDVELLQMIKHLLYDEKFTIDGARQHLKDVIKQQGKAEESGLSAELFADVKTGPKADRHASEGSKKVFAKIKADLQTCLSELRK
jgi:DNA-binding transcriptional MerR regulator